MKEIETRIIDIDIVDIRAKLDILKAIKVKEENQNNIIFDFPDRRLLAKKGYARIRIIEDLINKENRYYMTTKLMLSQEKYKIMEEHEILISSDKEGKSIFETLGMKVIESIKKYRESYRYKNTLIEIDVNEKDYYPLPYIEIEAPNEAEVIEVVNLLGFTMRDTTSKTIHQLIESLKKDC